MSIEAIAWVFKQEIKPATTKFVLVVMANCANNVDGTCFPSTQYITDITGMDRKTVIQAIDQLEEEGYLTDTGERCGRTGQVKIMRLMVPSADQGENSPENGTLANQSLPLFPAKAPKFPIKGSQKRDTESSLTVIEPQREGARLTSHEEWQRRVDGYDRTKRRETWKPFWGLPPETVGGGHLIPSEILKAWQDKNLERKSA